MNLCISVLEKYDNVGKLYDDVTDITHDTHGVYLVDEWDIRRSNCGDYFVHHYECDEVVHSSHHTHYKCAQIEESCQKTITGKDFRFHIIKWKIAKSRNMYNVFKVLILNGEKNNIETWSLIRICSLRKRQFFRHEHKLYDALCNKAKITLKVFENNVDDSWEKVIDEHGSNSSFLSSLPIELLNMHVKKYWDKNKYLPFRPQSQ